ncbi:hypothetical protein [Entomomonas asaccharolytica]|uniref:Chitin-binding type-3 domain-containing protein n=1 Tax=Entomomonas asaccharolytica TaxID=2785331 RepID=A0A974NHY4_9GAMM|nr:hypothetical protein [Entomomonas asaccharolytica]QQP86954.1 hypothetical protein JHT90_06830 [Entomomonas asaccharolytica]
MIYNRPDENVFASTAKSGEVEDFPDILRGWGLTFDQTGGIPPMEWFNALGLRTDQAIQYFLQNGIAEWATETDYPVGAYVRFNNKVWRAKARNSANQPSTSNANWEQAALTLDEVKSLIPTLMTQEELDAGTSTTPKTVNAALLKTITNKIVTEFATDEETQEGVITDKMVSPAGLASVIATTEKRGLIQIATDEEVASGVNDTKAVTPASWKNNEKQIGHNQTWVNMASERQINVSYTNNTGKPIQIYVCADIATGALVIDRVSLSLADSAGYTFVSAIIPEGSTYRIKGAQNVIVSWGELR